MLNCNTEILDETDRMIMI